MSCHNHCGCMTPDQVTSYVESLVNQMIICGSIQAGLRACGGTTIIPGGTHIVTCEQLAEEVQQLINSGSISIPGIQDFELKGTVLYLTDQAGQTWDVDLASLASKGVAGFNIDTDGMLTIRTVDGTEFSVNLRDFVSTIVENAIGNATIKNGLLDKDMNLVLTDGNGEQIKIDMSPLIPVMVERDGPLTGDGTKENPLDLDLTKICWQVIESMQFTEEGLVIQIANQCDPITLPLDEILKVLDNKVSVCVSTEQGIIEGTGKEGECLSLNLDKLTDLIIKNDDLVNSIAGALDYKVKVEVKQGVTGDGTKANPLNVKLSPDSGNLLSLRDNGLYYGTQAAADVSTLYIDPGAGNDSNVGNTPQAPLKTLSEASRRVRADQTSTFALRAGQTFVMDWNIEASGGATRYITVYGEPRNIGGDLAPNYPSPEVPHYYPEVMADYQRPTIRPWVNYDTGNHTYSINTINARDGGKIIFIGINFDAKPVNDVDTGHSSIPADFNSTWGRYNEAMAYGNPAGTLSFRGCTFRTPECPQGFNGSEPDLKKATWWILAANDAQGYISSLQFQHCYWPKVGNRRLLYMGAAASQLYVTEWPSNVAIVNDQYPPIASNLHSRLLEEGAITGITKDGSGVPRNITTNLVL